MYKPWTQEWGIQLLQQQTWAGEQPDFYVITLKSYLFNCLFLKGYFENKTVPLNSIHSLEFSEKELNSVRPNVYSMNKYFPQTCALWGNIKTNQAWPIVKSRDFTSSLICIWVATKVYHGLPWWLRGKEPACHRRSRRSDPWVGRSSGAGHTNPLQYPCPENPTDTGAWPGYGPRGCEESDTTCRE